MGRPKRNCPGGVVYHVLNRANGRLRIFRKRADFEAFERILAQGLQRVAMRLCGYCIIFTSTEGCSNNATTCGFQST